MGQKLGVRIPGWEFSLLPPKDGRFHRINENMNNCATGSEPHSSAAEPAGTAEFTPAEKELIQRLIRARRDIRKFRPDPVPAAILRRILEAAHAAPSVGFMQPWNFILIESQETRSRIKESFEAVNSGEKRKLEGTAKSALYNSLKLEGIMESPLNIAVTCDHSRDDSYVLGRVTMPETAQYSVCLAIQNLWLAARSEGVGVGWVSLIDKAAVQNILGLPPSVELIAYLCVGYPLEFTAIPLLQEIGWKERERLDSLIYKESWGQPAGLMLGESGATKPSAGNSGS